MNQEGQSNLYQKKTLLDYNENNFILYRITNTEEMQRQLVKREAMNPG